MYPDTPYFNAKALEDRLMPLIPGKSGRKSSRRIKGLQIRRRKPKSPLSISMKA